ncbi:hypothetical protein [Shewanella oncorhynchi]|uniref:hypothetical protein n=1 Tax=Shewanella oncorhynchi TaxID=2726434 RepID=UPI002E7B521C|nr:hypothetical protein [Shewanella oncorhynchi]WVI91418.1 hypothetical protein VR487_11190 [Shewanella oncorhynchi]
MTCAATSHNVYSSLHSTQSSASKEKLKRPLKVSNVALSQYVRVRADNIRVITAITKKSRSSYTTTLKTMNSKSSPNLSFSIEELDSFFEATTAHLLSIDAERLDYLTMFAKADAIVAGYTSYTSQLAERVIPEAVPNKDNAMELIGKEIVLKNTINFTSLALVIFGIVVFLLEISIIPALAAMISGLGVLGSCGIQLNKIDELKKVKITGV